MEIREEMPLQMVVQVAVEQLPLGVPEDLVVAV
jgi:hypothetical protein